MEMDCLMSFTSDTGSDLAIAETTVRSAAESSSQIFS